MNEQSKIGFGTRVRYLRNDIGLGTVFRRKHVCKSNPDGKVWLVKWDNDPHAPRLLDAHEENFEVIDRAAGKERA